MQLLKRRRSMLHKILLTVLCSMSQAWFQMLLALYCCVDTGYISSTYLALDLVCSCGYTKYQEANDPKGTMLEILKAIHESTISYVVKFLREEDSAKHREYIDNLPMRHR